MTSTTQPCVRCRKPLQTFPETPARIYLCPECIEALGGETKARNLLKKELPR